MAQISTENRGRVIGLIQAGVSQREVARCLHCHQSSVARLWEKYQRTGMSNVPLKNVIIICLKRLS